MIVGRVVNSGAALLIGLAQRGSIPAALWLSSGVTPRSLHQPLERSSM